MVGQFRLDLDASAMDDILNGEVGDAYEDLVQDVVDDIADAAAAKAPRDSGQGAGSIHGEVHRGHDPAAFASTYKPEDDEPTGYVSWDQDHFFMGFKELGTEHEPAQPFLRPALDGARI